MVMSSFVGKNSSDWSCGGTPSCGDEVDKLDELRRWSRYAIALRVQRSSEGGGDVQRVNFQSRGQRLSLNGYGRLRSLDLSTLQSCVFQATGPDLICDLVTVNINKHDYRRGASAALDPLMFDRMFYIRENMCVKLI